MELLTPGSGLLFWQVVVFLALLFLLKKFAWRPILESLRIREESIQEALDSAKETKEEMVKLKANNENLLTEARGERDKIIKAATHAANSIKDVANTEARGISDKIIADAKSEIESQKNAALAEVKNQVVKLSVEIAEKLIRQTIGDEKTKKSLVETYLKDKSLN
jgi:F-type H+-transporting ATPase subunit b